MEHLIDAQHGPVALLASLVVVLVLHLMLKMGEFVWDIVEKRNQLKERNIDNLVNMISGNTDTLLRVESRLSSVEEQMKTFSIHAEKTETSTRRTVAAIKKLAGDNWPDVRKHILEDDIT